MKVTVSILCLITMVTPLAFTRQAQATLGEGADSIARDRRALSAAPGITTNRTNYSVQEVTSDGTTIREYLNPSGVVFAVAWNGLIHPDLTTLLGSYEGEFQAAKRQSPKKHGQKRLKVRASRVTVETWGHMRNLQGRAYLPALLPEGVSADEIK
jgi:hypothetical protein